MMVFKKPKSDSDVGANTFHQSCCISDWFLIDVNYVLYQSSLSGGAVK